MFYLAISARFEPEDRAGSNPGIRVVHLSFFFHSSKYSANYILFFSGHRDPLIWHFIQNVPTRPLRVPNRFDSPSNYGAISILISDCRPGNGGSILAVPFLGRQNEQSPVN